MELNSFSAEFRQFLHDELDLSPDELAVVLRQQQANNDPIPMLLWQYGLVSLRQLQRIFDWLDDQVQWTIPQV